jgi:transglutaminase-like putative cysteine protease
LIALSLGTELDTDVLLLIFAGYVGSVFAEGKLIERKAYNRSWNLSVVAMFVLQCIRAGATEPTLAMAIEFAAFLQISRLWNRRTAADYQQIAVLAFVHLIAATVLSASLSYALIFVGFVIATPWMLALSQLRREIEGNYPASVPNDERAQAAVRRVLASKRVVGASFLVNTALLALPLFAMTLTIFVVVPRVGQGFLNLSRSHGQRVAGFGSQVELGGFGVIRDDPTVVLRVTPLPKVDERAPRMSLRMRGTSFDPYDGKRWTRSPSSPQLLPNIDREQYLIRRPADRVRDQALQIILDHLDEPVVFIPYGAVAITVPPRVVHAQAVARNIVHSAGLDLRYEDPDELGLVYTAYVTRDPSEMDLLPTLSERRQRYLQLPKGHEKIAELAARVKGDAPTPIETARRVLEYLHSSRFKYSLEQPEVKNENPLDVFLFKARRGHCEYFASAMAIMLRTLEIPTRNVTGFVGGRYNPYGGYYALRQGDAHSWVEAYIEGRGWVTFDPTPPSRSAVGPRQSVWADLQALIDAMRTRWMTSVVGYDLRTQVNMLRRLARFFATQDGAGANSGAANELTQTHWKTFGRNALVIVLVACVIVGLWRWRTRRRRKPNERHVPEHVEQAVKLYRDLERALASSGYARPTAVTPVEHARALKTGGFACASDVQDVTESYMRVRYGGEMLPPSELPKLRSAVARVRKVPQPRAAAPN